MKKVVQKVVAPNWREVVKRWSFLLSTAGTVVVGYAIAAPEAVLHVWLMMPDDLKAVLPPNFVKQFGIALFIASNVAMILKQRRGEK